MDKGSAIALVALAALFFLPHAWQAAIGGGLFAVALGRELGERLGHRLRRQRTQARVKALDWSVIDSSLHQPRPMRDCERQETLGVCTGRECLVYDDCNYNIKRVGL